MRGRGHRHLPHAGRPRRDRAHDDRGRIGRPAARRVHRRAAHRDLAQAHALALGEHDVDVRPHARGRHAPDVLAGDLEPGPDRRVEPVQRRPQLRVRHPQRPGAAPPPKRSS